MESPVTLKIQPFLRSRINEIEALTNLIETPNKNVAFAKKFPLHMRRRAMSQNIKRLPTRLRDEMTGKRGEAIPLKRPRRKYRRRPANLLDDYNRRQRQFIWLETHIWHAKRFHMIEKWGYKLPNFPNDKSYRACYRASAKLCLIQDISYYCCIELSGKHEEIINGLNTHASVDCGLTFNSSYIQSGNYEGALFFYSSNKYPKGGIGEVKYIWKPANLVSVTRTLWLWCHPAFYNEVVAELIKTFTLELEESMSVDDSETDIKDKENNIEITKLALRNVPFIKTPKYVSQNNSITMSLLKDTLNRFRLTGPLSQALVTEAFRPIDLSKRTLMDWSLKYYKDSKNSICNKQYEFWEKMKNVSHPAQLPRHFIYSSIVVDPRFTLPTCRKKAEGSITEFESQSILSTEAELSFSPLWSSEIRDEVTCTKLSAQQLNDKRSEKLVPGLEIELSETNFHNLPAIPILLIQNPGENNDIKPLGYGGGWDIIVPCGYGHPVWLALSLHGGRAGGLKESMSVLREQGLLAFPPDTAAGELEDESKRTEDTEKYFALPPAKRLNYIKIGIPTPFYSPWKILSQDWSGSSEFYVLRKRSVLISLKAQLKYEKQSLISFESEEKNSLVPVRLVFKDKGTLSRNAHICIPSIEDLTVLKEQKTFTGPVEMLREDPNELKRKSCRLKHKSLLKSLARKRHKYKKSNDNMEAHNSEMLVAQQKEIMRKLWLPGSESVKNCCSRTIIGFVSEGDYSFTNARTCGVGYVSFGGLLELLVLLKNMGKQSSNVLVRNTSTSQYRFASLDIIC